MKTLVVGSGYVGLVVSACLAELGHQVVCVDQDESKIRALNAGESLIHEEFLPELLQRHRGINLRFSTSLTEGLSESLVVFIAVGTPVGPDGKADLSQVEAVTHEIARSAQGYKLIVEKSTVPVYTNTWIHRAMVLNGCENFDIASNPEFLREGTAATDFLYPDRIVVGAGTERAAAIMKELYRPLLDGSYYMQPGAVPAPDRAKIPPLYLETSAQSAELIKHTSNAFLAMKISFINAVAGLCEAAGADIEDVCKGLGSDSRIGPRFLRPGIGYGGSCFPKDVAAFRAVARELGCQFALLDEVYKMNEEQRRRFIEKARTALWTLKNKRLAVLGLAYKGGTDDIRESPAIYIVQSLLKEGCQITAFDPAAMQRATKVLGDAVTYAADPYEAMAGADALLILTEWSDFASLDLSRVKKSLKFPIVLDGRNLYSPGSMAKAGLNYFSVGRPSPEYVLSEATAGKHANEESRLYAVDEIN